MNIPNGSGAGADRPLVRLYDTPAMHVTCPNPECGQSIAIEREHAGTIASCPTCGQSMQLPALIEIPAEQPRSLGAGLTFTNKWEMPNRLYGDLRSTIRQDERIEYIGHPFGPPRGGHPTYGRNFFMSYSCKLCLTSKRMLIQDVRNYFDLFFGPPSALISWLTKTKGVTEVSAESVTSFTHRWVMGARKACIRWRSPEHYNMRIVFIVPNASHDLDRILGIPWLRPFMESR